MTVSSTSLMDGINRHVLAIAPALNRLEGVEVGVVTLHKWGEFNDALAAAGVKCWSLDCANGHQLKVLPRFCRVMRDFKPDVIHVHVMGFLESVVHKWLYPKVKRVVTIHGISDPIVYVTLKMRLKKWIGVNLLCRLLADKNADAQIYISHGVKTSAVATNIPSFLIYNPMKFASQTSQTSQTFIIGTACRVADVKDPLAFTRIMGEVTKRIPNCEGWLIGDGPALAACRGLAQDRGYDKIKFWGFRSDAKDLIAQMNCFIMTSKREGMPGALLEAMSVKTPIAFMKGEGGLRDLAEMNRAEGPFAVVVDPGDEAAMVDGVCDLLKDRTKAAAYAERAFEVGKRHFDLSAVVRQLRDVYEGVMKGVK